MVIGVISVVRIAVGVGLSEKSAGTVPEAWSRFGEWKQWGPEKGAVCVKWRDAPDIHTVANWEIVVRQGIGS